MSLAKFGGRIHAEQRKRGVEFVRQDAERFCNARPAACGKPIGVSPADQAARRAKRQRFHDVDAAPDPAVHKNWDAVADRPLHKGKSVERGRCVLQLSRAMVRDNDRIRADVERLQGVVGMKDPLDEKGSAPSFAEPCYIVPGGGVVEQACDMLRDAREAPEAGRALEIADPDRPPGCAR